MQSGCCFELPTWELPIDESACSSLLPTPAAQEPGGTLEQYHERLRKADGRAPTFAPLGMLVQLLPTPTTSDAKGPSPAHAGTTAEAVRDLLLPTPSATNRGQSERMAKSKVGGTGQKAQLQLAGAVQLLPTPTTGDAGSGRTMPRGNLTLKGAVEGTRPSDDRRHGVPTNPPSVDGSESSDEWLLDLWTSEDGSPPPSSSG